MEIIYLIQLLLTILLLTITRKLYTYGDYEDNDFDIEDKMLFPIILYILFIIVNLIPIVGIIVDLVIIIVIAVGLVGENIYYKPGKIVKFLFQKKL